jgi:cyd operon protein YbgT
MIEQQAIRHNGTGAAMWYFTWILGLGLALAFGIINVMWLESSYFSGELDEVRVRKRFQRGGRPID